MLQWLQNESKMTEINRKHVGPETSRIFRKNRREEQKNQLETNNENTEVCTNKFKKGLKTQTNVVKGENCDLPVYNHSVLKKAKELF